MNISENDAASGIVFRSQRLDLPSSVTFESLRSSIDWEVTGKGRCAANLVDVQDSKVPIVRTTTSYQRPNQRFLPIHAQVRDAISKQVAGTQYNNVLAELYDHAYRRMGFHKDQSLDLAIPSVISVFSLYNNPATKSVRTLRIKNLATSQTWDVRMEHQSVVSFSTDVNATHVHQILLTEAKDDSPDVLWLGMTFRHSKTMVHYRDDRVFFCDDDRRMVLADGKQRGEFLRAKGSENAGVGTRDDRELSYTLSEGDMVPPIEFQGSSSDRNESKSNSSAK
jgi:hypothetical protein